MNNIRNGWENIDELTGIPGYGIISAENFIRGRSQSIYSKVKSIFIRDFIFKTMGSLFIIANLMLYRENETVMLINSALLLILALTLWAEIRDFKEFKKSADPGHSSKQNLSYLLTFLERKFPLSSLLRTTSYITAYIPAMLLYFILEYGYFRLPEPMGLFVYLFILITGMIFSYILDIRQGNFHSRHVRICLSDLNDNALALASENIESKRKFDTTLIVLTQIIILLLFLVIIIILKSGA